jgi:hypothetical protein
VYYHDRGHVKFRCFRHFCPKRRVRAHHRYQITISGGLGATAREAFADFRIEPNGINTALIGELDQAALYGALNRILALGLELVALTQLNDGIG